MTEVTQVVERPRVVTEKEAFTRFVKLETDKLTAAADIKQFKEDIKYDEDVNPKGIDKDELKLIAKAAALFAKAKFEETKDAANAVFNKYEELTAYNK